MQNHLYFHPNQSCYHGNRQRYHGNVVLPDSHLEGKMALPSPHQLGRWGGVEAYSTVPAQPKGVRPIVLYPPAGGVGDTTFYAESKSQIIVYSASFKNILKKV